MGYAPIKTPRSQSVTDLVTPLGQGSCRWRGGQQGGAGYGNVLQKSDRFRLIRPSGRRWTARAIALICSDNLTLAGEGLNNSAIC